MSNAPMRKNEKIRAAIRDNHVNYMSVDCVPRMPGTNYPIKSNAPLWKATVQFSNHPQMKEILRAETKAAAERYLINRYPSASSVEILGRAEL